MRSAVGFGLRLMMGEWFVKDFVWCLSLSHYSHRHPGLAFWWLCNERKEPRPMVASFPWLQLGYSSKRLIK